MDEMEAVRTTIVGGRPPGSGKHLGEIPRGIEVLLKKAAVDPAFRRMLLERRADAADEIGLVLDAAEKMIINAAPEAQLEAVIARTRVDPGLAPAFLGKAAAVMLVALGASSALTSGQPVAKGERPDSPPAATAPAQQGPGPAYPVAGIAPRLLGPPTSVPASGPTSRPPTTSSPAAPDELRPVRGIRVAGVVVGPPEVRPVQPLPAPTTTTAPTSGPSAATVKDIPDLVKQLDADDYKVREAAQEKLTRLLSSDQAAVSRALSDALAAGKLTPEQRLRVENVLTTTRPVRVGPRIGAIIYAGMIVAPAEEQ